MAEKKKSIFDFADKFGYESPFGNWIEKDFKTSSEVHPTISFKGKVPEKIEINKKTLLEFIISGKKRTFQNNINVELITTDDNINFSTTRWPGVDYGFTLKTYVTAKAEGSYVLQFKVNGKNSNALNLSFYEDNKNKESSIATKCLCNKNPTEQELKEFVPKIASDLEYALMSAGWYWQKNNINEYADKDDIIGVSAKVNNPSATNKTSTESINGFTDIKKYYELLKEILDYENCI